jgi:IPT/TIG domain-containing protein/PASTA domain-containing protein
MKRLAKVLATLASSGAFALPLLLTCTANAAIVTVGSTGTPTAEIAVGAPATIFDTTVSGGASLTSPISGTIIRWHVSGFSGGPFSLQVLTPNGAGSYTSTGTSAAVTPASKATQTFSANVPINAGQTLAIKNTNGADVIGYLAPAGASSAFFLPPLGEGATGSSTSGLPVEYTYNAEVQPPPGVSAISPTSGSTAGGTSVLISGHDFTGATAVTFGGTPATSFSVLSESTITAMSPAHAAGDAAVSVTTLAGSANAPTPFTFAAPPAPTTAPALPVAKCVVPKLLGKHLKGAKKAIRARHCKVGQVTKKKGVTAKTGTVVKQSPKPGTQKKAGSAVGVKLG